ncbi:photosystem II protein PsbN [Aphanothece sacrum FPU1]|uniref:Protein PsbN n=1 Tax=Aphanothece sacrum FPU1 TaxID=1920663 RepID=A0A401IIN0_APHSA|nr:photosystem II protein PsbN [Aphanothece sacrum FPU1]GBF86206.1 photosystem II protein PsbN [Aphanothece sacrum FPU3]
MFCNIIEDTVSHLMKLMEPATVLSITIAAILVVITGFAIYTAFGPPATQLDDPFEDHED